MMTLAGVHVGYGGGHARQWWRRVCFGRCGDGEGVDDGGGVVWEGGGGEIAAMVAGGVGGAGWVGVL